MPRKPRVSVPQRRARLVRRHHLNRTGADVTSTTRGLIGLHSSDAASVYLAARARIRHFATEQLETALYEKRVLARVLGMRRTMFVVPVDLAPVVHAACTRDLAKRERNRTIQFIEDGGVAKNGARWLTKVEGQTLDVLEELGSATAAELSRRIPALRKKIPVGVGKKWEGEIGVSTRVLFLLANHGKIVRTKPRGSWLSTQYEWSPLRSWLGTDIESLDSATAQAELVRLWLGSFGPGTPKDLKWWTGWTAANTARALTDAGAVEVDLDGNVGFASADDLDAVQAPKPGPAFLPSLDSTVMGWFERDWYLGDHRPRLFDRNGNAGPTVWWGGRVIGGWAQRPGGEVVYRILEDVGASASAAVETEAANLQMWLGAVRVIPRFRTPLERELGS
ncbi:MAG: winged helix DNA-binding domain-containing protein [Actinomycetota bacterium]|nr:winged helix DNA-binding domain-containing protein [Actinomycetota bacterium]